MSTECTSTRRCRDWATLHMSRHLSMNDNTGEREIIVQHHGYIIYRELICEWVDQAELEGTLNEIANDDDWEMISEPSINEIFEGAGRFNLVAKLRMFSTSPTAPA